PAPNGPRFNTQVLFGPADDPIDEPTRLTPAGSVFVRMMFEASAGPLLDTGTVQTNGAPWTIWPARVARATPRADAPLTGLIAVRFRLQPDVMLPLSPAELSNT